MNQLYHIREGDSFYSHDYPEVGKELTSIRQGLVHVNSSAKAEMIISYYDDHCLKTEWVKNDPEVAKLITSHQFKAAHLEGLFVASRNNNIFLSMLKDHIRGLFSSETSPRSDTEEQSVYLVDYSAIEYIKDPEQRWRKQKAALLIRFSHLVEADFRYDYGMKEVMMTKLQAKLGKSRKELNALLLTL